MPSYAPYEIDGVFNEAKDTLVDIVIVRVKKVEGYPLAMSKPCSTCLPVLKQSTVRRVYYTTDDAKLVSELVSEMETDHVCLAQRLKMGNL